MKRVLFLWVLSACPCFGDTETLLNWIERSAESHAADYWGRGLTRGRGSLPMPEFQECVRKPLQADWLLIAAKGRSPQTYSHTIAMLFLWTLDLYRTRSRAEENPETEKILALHFGAIEEPDLLNVLSEIQSEIDADTRFSTAAYVGLSRFVHCVEMNPGLRERLLASTPISNHVAELIGWMRDDFVARELASQESHAREGTQVRDDFRLKADHARDLVAIVAHWPLTVPAHAAAAQTVGTVGLLGWMDAMGRKIPDPERARRLDSTTPDLLREFQSILFDPERIDELLEAAKARGPGRYSNAITMVFLWTVHSPQSPATFFRNGRFTTVLSKHFGGIEEPDLAKILFRIEAEINPEGKCSVAGLYSLSRLVQHLDENPAARKRLLAIEEISTPLRTLVLGVSADFLARVPVGVARVHKQVADRAKEARQMHATMAAWQQVRMETAAEKWLGLENLSPEMLLAAARVVPTADWEGHQDALIAKLNQAVSLHLQDRLQRVSPQTAIECIAALLESVSNQPVSWKASPTTEPSQKDGATP